MSKLGEFVLRKLSRDPTSSDHLDQGYEERHSDVNAYVRTLEMLFPEIRSIVTGKTVLDIGCSEGMEAFALFSLGAKHVHGIDIRIDQKANHALIQGHSEGGLEFSVMDAHHTSFPDSQFDVIVTCGSFEHFADPFQILKECKRVLKDDGKILVTSSVWAHPWGAHMKFFTKLPWVQFAFSEETIMKVRSLYRDDGATRFNEVEGGLNKIGIRGFHRIMRDLNLRAEYIRLRPVKGLAVLIAIPFLNEMFTNLIIGVLEKTI